MVSQIEFEKGSGVSHLPIRIKSIGPARWGFAALALARESKAVLTPARCILNCALRSRAKGVVAERSEPTPRPALWGLVLPPTGEKGAAHTKVGGRPKGAKRSAHQR